MNKLLLIFHTIRHLRPVQIRYQIWYRLRKIWQKATGFNYPLSVEKQGTPVKLQPWIEKPVSYKDGTYTFLNIEKRISPPDKGGVSSLWRDEEVSKLWSYNFNYMDYLLQPGMNKQTGMQLINQFIQNLSQNPTGLEPYPIALRGINWIKFLSSPVIARSRSTAETTKQSVPIQHINSSLYAQYLILLNTLEYHLLANHLLEDGFSLLFGAFYFNDPTFYNKAKQIIETELNEQILDDGAHFELSPMYHQIILDRLLDGINLLQNNQRFGDQQQKLLKVMQDKAQKMLTWLNTITFSTGQIPLLNDSAPGIAPTTEQLNNYATSLNFELETFSVTPIFSQRSARKDDGGTNPDSTAYRENFIPETLNPEHETRNPKPETLNWKLSASGYRKFTSPSYECIIDIGQIGPSYQPGHAHADTFSFVLNVYNEPVLVDTGISTYDAGKPRLKERGTAAHNTVTVQDKNSSEVWSSFRVARRAKVKILKDDKNNVVAQHDGYKRMGTTHQREWNFSDDSIEITDTLYGNVTDGKAHFWLSPQVNPKKTGQTIEINNTRITFENPEAIDLISTQIPAGYNKFVKAFKIEIAFKNQLKTIITQI